ncbi:MAG: PHP domain-containing protein [Chromatiales bacterium]|nr:PHP domain-containing protein [Chromatiales bacterium]
MNFDLHSHSRFSDGTLAPADLVAQARVAGVDVLALTDHDTTDGLAEARAASRLHGIELVAGVEISVEWRGRTVHVVGLGIDAAHPAMVAGLAFQAGRRAARAIAIGERLERSGIGGAYADAAAIASDSGVSRTHFARVLVGRGVVPDARRAFTRYLREGKPGWVRAGWATLEQAVGWIRTAGGVAVIAHPARYDLTHARLNELCEEFEAAGGEAIEVVCGSHGPEDVRRISVLARTRGLYASAGSDFHGPGQGYRELGRLDPLPPGLDPVWLAPPLAAHLQAA